MKIREFNSYDEYETYYEDMESAERYEVVDIVRTGRDICADLMTDTKSAKTALNRFFRAVKDHKLFADWEDEIRESVENGYYKCNEYEYSGFIWEIEDLDGSFYIMIKMKNEYVEAVA